MATRLDNLKKFTSTVIKTKGTGCDIEKAMAPVSKTDITPWNRERSYLGTQEFEQQFNIHGYQSLAMFIDAMLQFYLYFIQTVFYYILFLVRKM